MGTKIKTFMIGCGTAISILYCIDAFAEQNPVDPQIRTIAEYLIKNGQYSQTVIAPSNMGVPDEEIMPKESLKYVNKYQHTFVSDTREVIVTYTDAGPTTTDDTLGFSYVAGGFDAQINSYDSLEIRINRIKTVHDMFIDGVLNNYSDYAIGFSANLCPELWDESTSNRINKEYQDILKQILTLIE